MRTQKNEEGRHPLSGMAALSDRAHSPAPARLPHKETSRGLDNCNEKEQARSNERTCSAEDPAIARRSTKSLQDLGHTTGTNGAATLTDSEAEALFHGDGLD